MGYSNLEQQTALVMERQVFVVFFLAPLFIPHTMWEVYRSIGHGHRKLVTAQPRTHARTHTHTIKLTL